MKQKTDVRQGTLDLMVLKTLDVRARAAPRLEGRTADRTDQRRSARREPGDVVSRAVKA
jgi:hypothetical protein